MAKGFFVDPMCMLGVAQQIGKPRYRIVAKINLHGGNIPLFDGYRLGEVARLIDVLAFDVCDVVGE